MKIGVLAASSVANPDAIAPVSALTAVAYPEVDLQFHPQVYAKAGHFAGTDAVRAAAFLEFANDPGIDAIWFLRGGYGSNRIVPTVLPQLNAAARHKTYLGYSDVGFLLGALYARRIGRPVHGPMASDVRRTNGDQTVARSAGWLGAIGRGWSRDSMLVCRRAARRRRSTCRSWRRWSARPIAPI